MFELDEGEFVTVCERRCGCWRGGEHSLAENACRPRLLVPLIVGDTGGNLQGKSTADLTSTMRGRLELLVEETLSSSSTSLLSELGAVVSCASGHESLLQGLSGGVCWTSSLIDLVDRHPLSLSDLKPVDSTDSLSEM